MVRNWVILTESVRYLGEMSNDFSERVEAFTFPGMLTVSKDLT